MQSLWRECEGQTPGPTPLKFLYRPCQRQCEECAHEAPVRATEPLRGEDVIQSGEEKVSASRTSTITLKTGGPVSERMHSHAFEAKDTTTNLHVAVDRFQGDIDALNGTQWK